ncbi:MAG: hypothetical protein ABI072_10180 [Edaphobacter sp.]
MSAAVVVLPMVWATAASSAGPRKTGFQRQAEMAARVVAREEELAERHRPDPSLGFYRKYTEAMLRRYVRMAMGAGRVPSLLGRELFRSKVTNYRVEGFDDMVIFVQDVEHCVARLDRGQQLLVERIAMQEYTLEEAAALVRLTLRTVERSYPEALDLLTELFLEKRLLDPQKSCQEG